jgi:hypothetical protein
VAYQHRCIKLEVRLNELALPLLEGLEQALMEEIPDYSTIGLLENQCIKLLISFDKKSKIIMSDIKLHRSYLESLEETK